MIVTLEIPLYRAYQNIMYKARVFQAQDKTNHFHLPSFAFFQWRHEQLFQAILLFLQARDLEVVRVVFNRIFTTGVSAISNSHGIVFYSYKFPKLWAMSAQTSTFAMISYISIHSAPSIPC